MRNIDKQGVVGNPLIGDAKEFVIIPESIIKTSDADTKRVAAYIYFWLWAGRHKQVTYTIEHLVSWSGFIPNSHEGKSDEQFSNLTSWLNDIGYISHDEKKNDKIDSKKHYTTLLVADLNPDWYKSATESNRFTILYLDEINKIMNYDCGKKSKSLTNSNILLVFAYLRLQMPIRNSTEGESQEKRLAMPEVFYSYYKDISIELGINEKTLSSILKILSNELELIYMQHIKREESKEKDGTVKWTTFPTFFCNRYKRLQGKLIYSGFNYYNYEIQNKINKTNFNKFDKTNTKVEDSETGVDITWLDKI